MNIKQFVEDSEREFDRDIPQYAHNRSDRNGLKRDFLVSEVSKVKSFTSSKLRELIGEVRTTIEEQMKQCSEYIENPPWGDSDMWQSRLDGMAQIHGLLDEAGGGK